MAASHGRFRDPKSVEEESSWLEETLPKNTRYNTKWALKIFDRWQKHRGNKIARNESFGFECKSQIVSNAKPKLDVSNAGNLDGNLPDVESLGGVHERIAAKNESAGFSDCFNEFDCNISDDILASIDLLSILPSCPISNERISSVMENVAGYRTFNNCALTLL